jgi:hypothetical protein
LMVIAAALSVLFSDLRVSTFTPTAVGAAEQGSFGEKKGINTAEEAFKALKKYFEKKDVVIGEVTEKELYFEAEIRDRKNTVIDKVVVDKRTGRIRSIY